jgi:hypothetical protein
MDELKELLKDISQQLASIDMKLSVIANASQRGTPMGPGMTSHWFSVGPIPTVESQARDEASS